VDWARRPYTTSARLHDSPDAPLVDLVWYFTDQPALPPEQISVVNCRGWDSDPWEELSVGERAIPTAERVYNGRWQAPAFMPGNHMCRSEWFATGEPWPTELPDTVYDDENIPRCCGRPNMCVCVEEQVIAGGNNQATATEIAGSNVFWASPGAGRGMRLPAREGAVVWLRGGLLTQSCRLYPPVGERINSLPTNDFIQITNGGREDRTWIAIRYPAEDFPENPSHWSVFQIYEQGAGTVTSVGLVPPAEGITVAGSPVTGAGDFALSLADDLGALEALTGTDTLYYRSGVSTWAPVAFGAGVSFAGGVLSAAATPAPFAGARVERITPMGTPVAALTVVPFESSIFDTASFWSAGNPTRLTVPVGVSWAEFTCGIRYAATGILVNHTLRLRRNGTAVTEVFFTAPMGYQGGGAFVTSGPVAVVPGDYFEAFVETSNAKNIDGTPATFFSVKVLG
jgi:hypothetical protein